MAERRMFSLSIVDSDAFLDMPQSSQNLYFHLGMRADDDGFINSPKKIQKMVGSSEDDLKLLVAKKFIIPFDSGVVVIKHWKINNFIRNDRYKETVYQEEKKMLETKENKAYTLGYTNGIPMVDQRYTQDRLGKDRLGKDSIDTVCLVPEEPEPDRAQAISLTLNDKTEYWLYQDQVIEWTELFPSVDVMQELRKMKSWLDSNPSRRKTRKGILRFVNGWLSKEQDRGRIPQHSAKPDNRNKFNNFEGRAYDMDDLERKLLERD